MFDFKDFKNNVLKKIDEFEEMYSLQKNIISSFHTVNRVNVCNHITVFDIHNEEKNNRRYLIGVEPELTFKMLIEDESISKQLVTLLKFSKTISLENSIFLNTSMLPDDVYDYAMIDISDESISINIMESSMFINITEQKITLNGKENSYSLNHNSHIILEEITLNAANQTIQSYMNSLKKNLDFILPKLMKATLQRLHINPETATSSMILQKHNESIDKFRKNYFEKYGINYITAEDYRIFLKICQLQKNSDTINFTKFSEKLETEIIYSDTKKSLTTFFDGDMYYKLQPLMKKIFTNEDASFLYQIQTLINFYKKLVKLDTVGPVSLISISKVGSKYNNTSEIYQFSFEGIIHILLILDDAPYNYSIMMAKQERKAGKAKSMKEIFEIVYESVITKIESDISLDREYFNKELINLYRMIKI